MSYTIEERPPEDQEEIDCRSNLLSLVKPIANDYDLDVEPATAQVNGGTERVQIVFLEVSQQNGPWCIGAIVQRNSGELRAWERGNETDPLQGSNVITEKELSLAVLNMVDTYSGG